MYVCFVSGMFCLLVHVFQLWIVLYKVCVLGVDTTLVAEARGHTLLVADHPGETVRKQMSHTTL